jgi:hypothetical protein
VLVFTDCSPAWRWQVPFLLPTLCLMLSQCGSSAPSRPARPYRYPSSPAHPPLYPRSDLFRTPALGCRESTSRTPSACRGDALCTGSFPGSSHKARLFPSCGPGAKLTNSALVALVVVSRAQRFTSLLHCSRRPVRIPDKYRDQRQCTLGPLSYRNADVKLFETIF